MSKIIWLPVVGFEGSYEVSDAGDVRSLDRQIDQKNWRGNLKTYTYKGKLLKLQEDKDGYIRASLYCRKKLFFKPVHLLVLEAFVGERPGSGDMIHGCHGNGDKKDNRLSNLRWDTKEENCLDRDRHGTTARGEAQGSAKLTEEQVREIRKLHVPRSRTLGNVALAKRFGVSDALISNIIKGKNWKHV